MTNWITTNVVLAIHDRQIAEHGGRDGLRDSNILESALARPQHLKFYGGDNVDIADLAAAYAFGIAKNHAFVDGNKRTSLAVTELFLECNSHTLIVDDATCVETWTQLGDGGMTEEQFAEWLRANIRRSV